MIFGKNRKHKNVGRRFFEPFFDEYIVITAYNNNRKWWFKFEEGGKNEHRNQLDFRVYKNREDLNNDAI